MVAVLPTMNEEVKKTTTTVKKNKSDTACIKTALIGSILHLKKNKRKKQTNTALTRHLLITPAQ